MWFVIGALTGWLAGQVLKNKGFGPIRYSVVGVVGALAGGLLAAPIFKVPYAVNSSNLISLLVAFLGAIVLIVIVWMFRSLGGQSWSHR
jgi:uncharacterized membrane protein YeaQ/YmgE (transglycosylase-associated protein family)